MLHYKASDCSFAAKFEEKGDAVMKAVTAFVFGLGLTWLTWDTVKLVVHDYERVSVWLSHTTPTNIAIFWGLTVVAPAVIIMFCFAGREGHKPPR